MSSKKRVRKEEEEVERVERKRSSAGHYTFQIRSYSLLSGALGNSLEENGVESCESPDFEVCGYKWKLALYPNGNSKLGGEDHVSLYLVLADADSHPLGSEVNAMFKLLVFDHIRDKFLAVYDGEARRFHAMKKEWGFTRFMSHEAFEDVRNGYLVNDCCVFGAEVTVIPSASQIETLSFIKDPPNGTFTWKRSNFSTLGDRLYNSESFKVGGHHWKITMYPNGVAEEKGSSLSLYLAPFEIKCRKGAQVYAEFSLRVVEERGLNKDSYKYCYGWFKNGDGDDEGGVGCADFMPLSSLRDKSRGFLVNDCIIVEVKIEVISNLTTDV